MQILKYIRYKLAKAVAAFHYKLLFWKLIGIENGLFIFGLSSKKRAIKLLQNLQINNTQNHKISASIIIPAYNQLNYTAHCILSIFRTNPVNSFEIIVADDCSNKDNYEVLRKIHPNVCVIRPPKNLGFLKNCNYAAKKAKGDHLVFLNNDCLPISGWLDNLIKVTKSDPSIGIVGSKLLNPDGSLQEAGGVMWKNATGWNYGRGRNSLSPEYNYIKEVDYCTGASFCVKKILWDMMQGFDEYFAPAYYEETDLSFRLRQKGYKTIYQPTSVTIHLEGISNGTDLSSGLKKYQVTNRGKFLDRWKEILDREHFDNGDHEKYARDRSGSKKHILFIDDHLPRYDQDAGSRQMMTYLKFFVKNGFQITFWPHDQSYDESYAIELEQIGIEVISNQAGKVEFGEWIKKNGKYLDISFLSRPHVSVNYFDLIRENSLCRIVYYGHDLHVERMNLQNRMVLNSYSEQTLNSVKQMEEECWDKSDVILYPSIDEVISLREKYPNRSINVLPIECRSDEEIRASLTLNSFNQRNGLLFVGGFSHLPNQDAVHWFFNEIYPQLKKKHPCLKVTIAGNAPTEEIWDYSNEWIHVTGKVSEEDLQSFYNKAAVVIVPLRIGAGVKGKVVEALRNGVPLVTTSIGVQGLPGYEKAIEVADDSVQFAKAVLDLIGDECVWQDRRDAGIKYFCDNFSETVVAPKVLDYLK